MDNEIRAVFAAFPQGLAIDLPLCCSPAEFDVLIMPANEINISCEERNNSVVVTVSSTDTKIIERLLQDLNLPAPLRRTLCG
ncbi:hypothetical protein ANRL3_00667 [Anaerolineae bacterium]|nr:hypothetical protein ANRL3_00667 [Anaerolineae bacterium]